MDITFNKYLKTYLGELEQDGIDTDEIEKRKVIILRFLKDKNVNLLDKRIKCKEDKTDIEHVRKMYNIFVHKYYHNRLKIADVLKDYLKDYPQIKTEKLFDNNERVLQLEKELQGNEENRLNDISSRFSVSEETIKADFKKKRGRNNLNLKDGFFLGEKLRVVDNMVYGKRYYNRKTTTPIFLNMGIGEIVAVLSALCERADKVGYGASGSLYKNLINKIYIQCSDYGKEIIKEYLSKNGINCSYLKDSIMYQMDLEEKFSDSWMNLLASMEKMQNFDFIDINGKKYRSHIKNVKKDTVIGKDNKGNIMEIKKENIINVV